MATTNFVSGTVIASTWLNDVDAAVYETLPEIGVHINQFSPAGDGTTDDLIPLTNFFNSAIANPGVPHYLGNTTYATSSGLPTINVSGVKIYGSGPSSNHDLGSINCTIIKKIGAAGDTIITVSPTSGASNQRLDSVEITGIAINGGQLAAKGILIKSTFQSVFKLYIEECTTSNWEMDVVASLGEARDVQRCIFHVFGRNMFTSAPVLRLLGDSGANVSLNRFEYLDVVHKDGTAVIHQNTDNNYFGVVRIYRTAGGTATNSIEWQGGASAPLATRAETYDKLTTTVAAIAKGTGTYTVAATSILIRNLDLENGTPVPTVEAGASVAGAWITHATVMTSSTGTLTTSSATMSYKIDPLDMRTVLYRIAATITTNGTGSGTILFTLPFASVGDGYNNTGHGIEGTTGKMLVATNPNGSSTLTAYFYDGTYPGADSHSFTIDGQFKKGP